MANTLTGLNAGDLYGRHGSIGCRDDALTEETRSQVDQYDPAFRLGNVLAGSTLWADGKLVALVRGVDQSASDLVLTTSWQRVPNTSAALPGTVEPNTLNVMGVAHMNCSAAGAVEFGLSSDAGTPPVNQFQQIALTNGHDEPTPFGGVHPDDIPETATTVYLWAKASSGTIQIQGLTGEPTHWGAGVQLPDSVLHAHLSSNGFGYMLSTAAGEEHGLVGLMESDLPNIKTNDVILARTDSGEYDGVKGALGLRDDGTVIGGSVHVNLATAIQFLNLARPSGGGLLLVDGNGQVYVRDEQGSTTSESASSTSTQVVNVTSDPVTSLSITLAGTYGAGGRVYVSLTAFNNSTRTGDFFATVRVDSVDHTTQSFPVDALGSVPLSFDIPIGALNPAQVVDVTVRRVDDAQAMDLALTGDTNQHSLVVYEQTGGSGEGEANTLGDVGGGVGISAGKNGTVLQAKSFTSTGSTVAITSTATTINLEALAGGSGDMTKAVYDPANINADAFARGNHTGTQAMATISDAGGAATLNVGTTVGTVAAGDDSRIVNAASQTDLSNHKAGTDEHSIAGVTGLTAALAGKEDTGTAQGIMDTHESAIDVHAIAATTGLQAALDAKGQVNTVVGGTDITVDATDPVNPVVNYTGSSGTTYGERIVTQSGVATETVAANEVLQITTDNTALTLDITAPSAGEVTHGQLYIIDGGSGNNLTFTGATTQSWPNGFSVASLASGDWVIGVHRAASGRYQYIPQEWTA